MRSNVSLVDTILVPQGVEYQAVCRGASKAGRQAIKIVPIPIGVDRLKQNLSDRNFWQSQPQRMLILGLCGSLSPQYGVGNALLYKGCHSLDGNYLKTDIQLTDAIYQQLQQPVSLVTGLTSDRSICQCQEKLRLAQKYPTQVVDMEGYEYLQLLQNQDIAVAILRVVSDDCRHDLPDLKNAINNGQLDAFKLAIAMSRKPLAAIRLIRGSLIGLKRLTEISTQIAKLHLP